MKTSTIVWIIVLVIVALGGWYWYSTMSTTTTTPVATEGTQATGPSTTAGLNSTGAGQTNTGQANVAPVATMVKDPALGEYLVAANGMTLYTYTKDTAGVSNCSGTCATAWPPYVPVANEPLVPGDGVTGQLATITRADGTMQLTYKGAPVYFYQKDTKPGDVTGHKVGGVWFVVKP